MSPVAVYSIQCKRVRKPFGKFISDTCNLLPFFGVAAFAMQQQAGLWAYPDPRGGNRGVSPESIDFAWLYRRTMRGGKAGKHKINTMYPRHTSDNGACIYLLFFNVTVVTCTFPPTVLYRILFFSSKLEIRFAHSESIFRFYDIVSQSYMNAMPCKINCRDILIFLELMNHWIFKARQISNEWRRKVRKFREVRNTNWGVKIRKCQLSERLITKCRGQFT